MSHILDRRPTVDTVLEVRELHQSARKSTQLDSADEHSHHSTWSHLMFVARDVLRGQSGIEERIEFIFERVVLNEAL